MNENKRIFTNTIFLYIRMVFVIILSLISIKLVYKSLGIENFGILNLVTGFVLLFSFLNNAMRNGTQRFLNVAYATGDLKEVKNTFSISFNVHVVISVVLFVLAETIGLWFLGNHLNIPKEKFFEAQVIYHLAIFSLIFTIISVPYQAMLIAKEKMTLYAYLSILDAILKFLSALILVFLTSNLLIYYGLALLFSSIIMFFCYIFLVGKRYKINYSMKNNMSLTKKIVSFSGWNILGQISSVTSNQGVTILFNIFFGVVANASFAISQQINALLNNFVSNLQMAFNPQIVESYVKGDVKRHVGLVLLASRYSLYLISLMSIPFLVSCEYILSNWLDKELPEYTLVFSKIVIFVAIIDGISGPFWMSAHARGDIKKYQIVISFILLLNLPLSYFLIKTYGMAEKAILSTITVSFFSFLFRFYYFKKGLLQELKSPQLNLYVKNLIMIFIFLFILNILQFNLNFDVSSLSDFIFINVTLELVFLIYLLILCIPKSEIKKCCDIVRNKLNFNS
ncbi:lipopolysaccharide biosynthesis protein [Acinetobacter sp. YH12140]|uniref:lipopolysaccharide biosynthesis protein n=1 Tax=Acinetobacter sp. YH12140 TaxID=2601124 RepID=UPI0015D20EA2|nr:hypothetical protein [Acinetobacter sp. YH12140]